MAPVSVMAGLECVNEIVGSLTRPSTCTPISSLPTLCLASMLTRGSMVSLPSKASRLSISSKRLPYRSKLPRRISALPCSVRLGRAVAHRQVAADLRVEVAAQHTKRRVAGQHAQLEQVWIVGRALALAGRAPRCRGCSSRFCRPWPRSLGRFTRRSPKISSARVRSSVLVARSLSVAGQARHLGALAADRKVGHVEATARCSARAGPRT